MSVRDFKGYDENAYVVNPSYPDIQIAIGRQAGGAALERHSVGLGNLFGAGFSLSSGNAANPDGAYLVVGAALRLGDGGVWGAGGPIILAVLGSGRDLCLQAGAGGSIVLLQDGLGVSPTTLADPAMQLLSPYSWYYVEMKVTFGTGDGSVVLRLDGVEMLTVSGLDLGWDTQSDLADTVLMLPDKTWGATDGLYVGLDDTYIIDDDMSADGHGYVDYLGDTNVQMMIRRADGTYQDWPIPVGSHWDTPTGPHRPAEIALYTYWEDGLYFLDTPPSFGDTYHYEPLLGTDDVPAIKIYTQSSINNDGSYSWELISRFLPGSQPGSEADALPVVGSGTDHQSEDILRYNPMLIGAQIWTTDALNAAEIGPIVTLGSDWLGLRVYGVEYIQKALPRPRHRVRRPQYVLIG